MVALVRSELEAESLPDRLEVLDPARSDDERRDARVAEEPGERQPRRGHAAVPGLLLERLERVEDRVVRVALVGLGSLRHARPVGVALPAPVLAREPSARERSEHLVAEPPLPADQEENIKT